MDDGEDDDEDDVVVKSPAKVQDGADKKATQAEDESGKAAATEPEDGLSEELKKLEVR